MKDHDKDKRDEADKAEKADKAENAERHILKDVLDNQLVDRRGRNMGKVDGIVIELREGKPPRLAYIEVGASVLARRLHPRLGEWALALQRKLTKEQDAMPFRIAWSKVRDIGIDVEVDLNAEETEALALEHWLRKHVIGRIPGA